MCPVTDGPKHSSNTVVVIHTSATQGPTFAISHPTVKVPVIFLLVLMAVLLGAVVARAQSSPFESPTPLTPESEIDKIVFAG